MALSRPSAQVRSVVFFVGIGVSPRSMDCAVGVFWWGIDRVELDILFTDVDDVMPHSGRHDESPIIFDFVALVGPVARPAKIDPSFSLLQPQELV